MIQAYPDGLSTRRSTIMAILAHGIALIANTGRLTEPFWGATGAVRLVPSADPAGFAAAVDALRSDRGERLRLGAAAGRLYEERFSIDRLVQTLIGDAGEASGDFGVCAVSTGASTTP